MSAGDSPGPVDPLKEAQIYRNRQQGGYFEKRSEDLAKKKPRLETRDWIQIIGQLIAFVAVLAALYSTYRSTEELRESREDAAFHEALERMGYESAMARASAAESLAAKAEKEEYYESVRSLLLHALLLEDDPVVLAVIQTACRRLKEHDPAEMQKRLEQVYEKLEVQVLESLAGLSLLEDGGVPSQISDERWISIEVLIPQTELTRQDLEQLIAEREKTFLSHQIALSSEVKEMTEEERKAARAQFRREFRIAVVRLRLVKTLIEEN